MDCAVRKGSANGYGVANAAPGLILRIELEDRANIVVIKRQRFARRRGEALGQFGKSIIGRAGRVDDYAGPRAGLCRLTLPSKSSRDGEQQHGGTNEDTPVHRETLSPHSSQRTQPGPAIGSYLDKHTPARL